MKNFAHTFLILLLLAGGVLAQSDPFGAVDTLYLDQLTVTAGREFSINVNLFNDNELGGLTLPFIYPTDKLEFQAIDFTGGRIAYINTKPVTINEAAGTILVGAIVFFEAFIPPGNGPLFKIKFKLKDGLTPGETATVDTTSLPPAYLLLTHANAANIIPYFKPGIITVAEQNQAPAFDPIADMYISEGDSLYLDISATDIDGDNITLANPIHPYNSQFVDNGDGTGLFSWKPDFVGPASSEHSPFEFVFWASDGAASSSTKVVVNVLNVNRPPQIVMPSLIEGEAGDSLGITVTASDPDFETLTWEIKGLPSGCSFDYENPGFINWVTDYSDSGHYVMTLIATDPFGLADTAQVNINLDPVTLYTLRIDTVSSFSGRVVDVEIFLKNKLAVGQFDLLINFDAALLYPVGVSNDGTRSENFEFFDYRLKDGGNPGDVRLMGRADVAGPPTGAPIGEGEGPICRVRVQVSPNLAYVGNQVPVNFIKRLPTDNVLKSGDGSVIDNAEINWFNGYVLIAPPGPILLGDINLNGLAFEISDAVYFSNAFISPGLFPLNEQQLLNSDINQDGFAPSVADLVMIVQVISGEIDPPTLKVLPSKATAGLGLMRDPSGVYIVMDSPVDIAGAFFQLRSEDIGRVSMTNLTEMDLKSDVLNDQVSCLMISYDGKLISVGEQSLIKLSDDPDLEIEIEKAEIADADGRVMNIEMKANAVIPSSFALHQNHPNPFNPVTEIRFDLDTQVRVTLSVYNILGQEIIRLADQDFPAGSHTVIWDGTDEYGQAVASGIYLYRIQAGEQTASRKMVLMK